MADSEVRLLNAVVKNGDISTLMGHEIDAYFEGYGAVWEFTKEHYTKYRALPSIETLTDKFDYFFEVDISSPTMFYLDELREDFTNHRLRQISAKILDNVGKLPAQRILDNSTAALNRVARSTNLSRDIDVTDTDAAEEHFEKTRQKALEMGGTPGIPMGISFMDASYTSGLVGGDLIVFLGYTGRAKSLMATKVACNAYMNGFKPLYITLEMPVEKVRARAYTMMGEGLFSNSDMEMGVVDEADWKMFKDSVLINKNFRVVPGMAGEFTPNMSQAKIDEFGSDILIVDYAQLCMDNARSSGMVDRMRNFADEMKAVAMRNDIPVIIISSATPESTASLSSPPVIEQVAWSKQLCFNADLGVAIHKHDVGDIIEIACRKNRNGDKFSGYFRADIDRGKYEEFFTLDDID